MSTDFGLAWFVLMRRLTLTAIVLFFLPQLLGCEQPAPLSRVRPELRLLSLPKIHRPASRPGAPQPSAGVLISAVGDCTLGSTHRTFAAQLARHGNDLGYPFSGVREVLQQDDLTIANLETPLTKRPRRSGLAAAFRGDPAYARILKLGSVELVDLANNHSHDCGGRGHSDTLAALDAAGVAAFGRERVSRLTVGGLEVVNLGFTGGHLEVLSKMRRAVADHKTAERLLIVSFHWGGEGSIKPTPVQYLLAREAIDAGADLVLGHHPHVLQGIERYRGKRIVYSLGNFVFGGDSKPDDSDSIIYQARFAARSGQMTQIEEKIIPVSISSTPGRNDYRPKLLQGAQRRRVLEKVKQRSRLLAPAVGALQ